MASNRMHRGLVALSASAIAAVYVAGYLRTQAADATIGAADAALSATPTAQIVVAAPPPATTTPTSQPVSPRQAPVVARSTATPQAQSQSVQAAYKDGTYTGQGTSRRGDVWVQVQVVAGRIANVSITRSTLQYPLRDIAGLPQQVVDRQGAQVDIVSRATYSSTAFRGAVSQALASAKSG
jgi:uncharacterized protein with FMN-binding domain